MERIDIDGPDVDYDESQLLLYRGEYFTGEAVEYYPGGRLWTLKTFVDGFEDGPTRQWFEDGSLQSEGVTKRNSAVGEWKTWFPGGRLERVSTFDDDGNLLTRTEWNEDGEIVKQSPPPPSDYGPGVEQ